MTAPGPSPTLTVEGRATAAARRPRPGEDATVCLAIPGRIVELREGGHLALADISGVRRTVNIDLLRDERVGPGDWVLIHVGFAMSLVDEARALEQLRLLSALGEAEAAREEAEGYAFDDGRADAAGGRGPPGDG